MARKCHSAEEIVIKLRQAEVELARALRNSESEVCWKDGIDKTTARGDH